MTDGVTQHRLGDDDRVDDVVGALDPQLELLCSHRMAAIEHAGVSLESQVLSIRRYFPQPAAAAPFNAAPRGCAERRRAKMMIRFAAL